ncbi:MAG TPA: hypothetical protein VHC18_14245 [Amycolatopsis sp.]|nr:hypothetical protein [Amycolatopsis sp.]
MITDAVFGVLYAVVDALVTLLPAWTMPDLGDTVAVVVSDIVDLNSALPVYEVFVGFSAVLATQVAFGLWGLVVWVYHQIHGAD